MDTFKMNKMQGLHNCITAEPLSLLIFVWANLFVYPFPLKCVPFHHQCRHTHKGQTHRSPLHTITWISISSQ